MIKSIIVEDDPNHSDTLIRSIKDLHQQIDILAVCTNIQDAERSINERKPELVFLDIELEGGGSGFELIKRFDNLDFAVIFTTQHNNTSNAINAIRLCALDFLPKPVLPSELGVSLNRFFENRAASIERVRTLKMNLELERDETKTIWISDIDRNIRVKTDNILYAQSENTTTFFFLTNEVYGKKKLASTVSIGKWEEVIERHGFCRIHNRNLVNLEHVVEFAKHDNTVKMMDGTILAVSKQRKDTLLRRLGLTKFH
jgi:two-component system LytT family response regulator